MPELEQHSERHPDGSIDTSVHGAILQIAINRPAKCNGFTPKMFLELERKFETSASP